MSSYQQLSLEERHYIELEKKKGVSDGEIGKSLGRNQSSIWREVNRNTGKRGYRHKQAQRLCEERHRNKPKAIKLTNEVKEQIDERIKQDWSPEQVAGRMKQDGIVKLHHETIYQYLLKDKQAGGELYRHLRHQNKTYRKRYGSANNRTGIPHRVDIEERPAVANNRERVGDWEGDTILGKKHKGAIVTLDERVTKLRLALPVQTKHAEPVKEAIIKLLVKFKEFVKTITFDNGKEFVQHEAIATALGCETYFAKPYHAWERGQNENANGLLRQYFPKTMELIDVKTKEVLKAVDNLNSRPRKCLDYKTPYEVFREHTGIDASMLLGYALIT